MGLFHVDEAASVGTVAVDHVEMAEDSADEVHHAGIPIMLRQSRQSQCLP